MTEIIKSPAKVVFIIMAIAACIALFVGLLSEANFMLLAGGAFTFYFANKGDTTKEYAGK